MLANPNYWDLQALHAPGYDMSDFHGNLTAYARVYISREIFHGNGVDIRGYVPYCVSMDLYHADIRLPDGFRLPNRLVGLSWTNHARQARFNDRYGEIPFLPVVNLGMCKVIEVGMEGRRVKKIVVRTGLNDRMDVIFVLIPGPNKWTVKTVWMNEKNDIHKTLDTSKYVR